VGQEGTGTTVALPIRVLRVSIAEWEHFFEVSIKMHDMSAHAAQHHAPPTSFLRKHVFSLDHKVIGKQYYALALLAALCGMVLSWLMRIHLGWTNAAIPGLQLLSKTGAPGGVMTPEYYLQLMTMHGTIMVFFVLTTAPFAAFGNFFLPIQVGAEDMPFPRFNMMSFWVTFLAFVVLMSSFFIGDGPTLGGWTQYAPLNSVGAVGGPGEGMGVILWMISIALFCIGQLLGSLNFITTTLDLRVKGMSLMRLPLTAWAWFITSCMGLTAFAVLMPACILVILDHVAGTSFFVASNLVINDQLQPHSGGSTLLWQHLFWFFGHPEVYIAIVPGIGIVSHILITSMRKQMLSQRVLIYCMGALAVLSYMVYGHHMFVSGMNPFSALAFSFPTLVITIPATIVVLIWVFSLYGSNFRINSASLFALGFISMFVSGGVSGFFLAQPSIDIMLHGTYFVVGHFHMVMGVAAMFGIFAGTYFWFPKMAGRMMNETLGKIHFWLSFVGTYCIFMPFHYLGMAGNIRRYSSFPDDYMQSLIPVHQYITVAALITGAAQLIFLYNLIHSRFWGKPAPDNPWEATSLEWSTATPPPFDNFGGKHPVVYHDPYQYGVRSSVGDYVMQTSPEQVQTEHDEK
jgi:cytochrome c oxidase subunit 1